MSGIKCEDAAAVEEGVVLIMFRRSECALL